MFADDLVPTKEFKSFHRLISGSILDLSYLSILILIGYFNWFQ